MDSIKVVDKDLYLKFSSEGYKCERYWKYSTYNNVDIDYGILENATFLKPYYTCLKYK